MAYTSNIQVEVDLVNGNLKFTDATDFVAQGVVQADVKGNFTITDPLGTVIHTNADFITSPDIDGSAPPLELTIPIPTDASGDYIWGEYILAYESREGNPVVNTSIYNGTFCFDFEDDGGADITHQVNCAESYIISTDNTSYQDLGSKVEFNPGTGVVTGTLSGTPSRVHTLKYPVAANTADLVSSNQAVQSPNPPGLANGRWETVIETTVTLVAGEMTVIYQLTDSQPVEVDCASFKLTVCKYLCAFEALYDKYHKECALSPSEAEKTLILLIKVTALYELLRSTAECGKDTSKYDAMLEEVLGDDCNCCSDCEDDGSIWVPGCTPPVAGNIVVVQGTSGNITVVRSTNDLGETQYTVDLDPSIIASISANAAQIALNAADITANSLEIIAINSTLSALNLVVSTNSSNITTIQGQISSAALTSVDTSIDVTNVGTLQWDISIDIDTTTPDPLVGQIRYGLEIANTAAGIWEINIINQSESLKVIGTGGSMGYEGGGLVPVPAFASGVTPGTKGKSFSVGRTWDSYMEILGCAQWTSSGTAAVTQLITTLPAGYRPTTDRYLPVNLYASTGILRAELRVLTTGEVQVYYDGLTATAINGLVAEFAIDQRIRLSE